MSSRIAAVILMGRTSIRCEDLHTQRPCDQLTLLGDAIQASRDARHDPIFVMLGAGETALERALAGRQVRVIAGSDVEEGFALSLAAAAHAIKALPEPPAGVLFLQADRSGVAPELLERLRAAFDRCPGEIIASESGRRVGLPAIFPRAFLPDLERLRTSEDFDRMLLRHRRQLLPSVA